MAAVRSITLIRFIVIHQIMRYFCAAVHWDNIYEVRYWSRGNSWYYAERACSLPLGIEPTYLFETDKGLCWLERATLFEVDHHKEESPSIIKTDDDDRNAIRDKRDTWMDLPDVSQGQNLINIVTGKISNKNVSVEEDAVQIFNKI